MRFEVVVVASVSFLLGTFGMYFIQRKYRKQELERIETLLEDVLNEREIRASASGKETFFAKIEHQLVRVQEVMQGRRDVAEREREEIQKLISEIAHQMRTPLSNIKIYLGFLQGKLTKGYVADQVFVEATNAIESSTEKLCFLVESFIKMSRLEHHVIQIKKEETNILNTVRNALGQIQSKAESKKIQIDIFLPEKVICVHDPNWLGEAFYNLLDNAVKYSEVGDKIEVSVSRNDMFLKIQVRDYGIGIEAGEENQIFQRFYRGKRVTTQEGFGIGLYLAREIVNRHGGFLVARRKSKGLLMEINLPSNLLEVC